MFFHKIKRTSYKHLEPKELDDITIIKNKIGLADETIKYLQNYKFGAELIRKIANAVK